MLLEHERDYVLGMHTLIIKCTRTRSLLWFGHGCFHHGVQSNTIVIVVWAWMLSSSNALEHERKYRSAMGALENERYDGLCMDALVTLCSWKTNVIMVWTWMLPTSSALEHDPSLSALEHARYDGSGMDALIIECTRTRSVLWFGHGCSHHRVNPNTNRIMVWAWILSSSSALEHERYFGWGMEALVTVCCWKRNKIADAFDNG